MQNYFKTMVPIQCYNRQHPHPHPHPPPPHSNAPPPPPSSLTNMMYRNRNNSHGHDLHRLHQHQQQHQHQPEEAQSQAERRQYHHHQDQGSPVVWRWIPFVAHRGADGVISQIPALPATSSSSQPRVIYATAKKMENTDPDDLPPMLTGVELREAREVLIRSKVDSLVASASANSALALRIPEVPTILPRHVNLVQQQHLSTNNNDDPRPHHRMSTVSQLANASGISTAAAGGGGADLEVATLLLNMGGSSPSAEKCSKKKKHNSGSKSGSPGGSPSSSKNNHSARATAVAAKPPTLQDDYLEKWISGSISLHTAEDDDVLSPLHCFMRRYCVEAFSATPEDVATPRYGKSHGFKVEVGQVGIRCLHCKDSPPGKRAERAVCYPSSLRNIYHSIETWQRRHSLVCKRITPWVRKSIVELMESSKTRAGGRRQYWEDSARRLGMVDTSQGVRFSRKPGDLGPIPSPESSRLQGNSDGPEHESEKVVRTEDKDLVTDYLFLLMDQMQTCRFTEEDRTGGRSKIKDNEVGFPGMECRHCQGRAGFGRYFPTSVAALSLANSDRNVYNHLQKCRRCPEAVKAELVRLQRDQSQSKNRRGLRKLFFNRIWSRMHADDDKDSDSEEESENSSSPSSPTAVVRMPLPHPSSKYVPYNGMAGPIPSQQPSMMAHPYHHKLHPQVAVNNFRGY